MAEEARNTVNIPVAGTPRFEVETVQALGRLKASLASPDCAPQFGNITLTDLTVDSLVASDGDKAMQSIIIGTGLEFSAVTLSLKHLGLEDLADPGADRIFFWDESADASKWLQVGNSVAITDTTLDAIQDIRTTASPTFAGAILTGLVTIDQDADAVGLNIDSEATTYTNYGLQVVTGAGAGCCYMSYGAADNGACWLGLGNNHSFSANFIFERNLAAASTDSAVVSITQDHDDDDQPALYVRNDGSGAAVYIASGGLSVAEGVTVSTGVTVPDDGYIGSVSEPQAMQIEADGDVVFHQAIDVPSDITCGGHVMFDVDNGHIGYYDNSPILTFNNADDRVEVTGDFYTTGNITDGVNTLTVANLDTAYDHSQLVAGNPHNVTPLELSLEIGKDVQAQGAILDDLNTLGEAASDGQFIVATGVGAFAYESGATARTSIGLGTAAEPTFKSLTLDSGFSDSIKMQMGSAGSVDRLDFYAQTANVGGAFEVHPNGTSERSQIALANAASGTNFGALLFLLDGANATIQAQTVGTPSTPVTTLTFSSWANVHIEASSAITLGDGGTTNYAQFSSTGALSFTGSATFLPPRVSQSAQPTPGVGCLMVWRDPDDSKTYLIYNDADEGVRKVEMA